MKSQIASLPTATALVGSNKKHYFENIGIAYSSLERFLKYGRIAPYSYHKILVGHFFNPEQVSNISTEHNVAESLFGGTIKGLSFNHTKFKKLSVVFLNKQPSDSDVNFLFPYLHNLGISFAIILESSFPRCFEIETKKEFFPLSDLEEPKINPLKEFKTEDILSELFRRGFNFNLSKSKTNKKVLP